MYIVFCPKYKVIHDFKKKGMVMVEFYSRGNKH